MTTATAPGMQILLASPRGFCAGVDRAIDIVERAIELFGAPIYVRHEVVHNRHVVERLRAMGARFVEELDEIPDGATVIFSAHSLPVRTFEDGTLRCKTCDCDASCRYRDGLQETADLVAARLGLDDYLIAWQSAGRTDDPWWGPPVEDVIEQLAVDGSDAVVVCSAGFVADHLEILYDLDIQARELAEEHGLGFERTEMPNADPAYLDVLAAVVRDHLAEAST